MLLDSRMTRQGQDVVQSLLLILLALTCCCCLGIHAKVIHVDGSAGSQCRMNDGVEGICREVRECLALNAPIRRNNIVYRCSSNSPPDIYVCCRQPAHITKTLCSAWSKFWRWGEDGVSTAGCLNEKPLVIGGVEAARGEFKHIAAVGRTIKNSQGKPYITWECGGTLISPYFVLTAAHCVKTGNKTKYSVRLGEHDTRNVDKSLIPRLIGEVPETLFKAQEINQSTNSTVSSEQTIEVEHVIRHPGYRRVPNYHDIAILRLKEPAVLTRFVLPACLPTEAHTPPSNGDILHAAGWGRTIANLRAPSPTLQKVDLPKVDNRICGQRFTNQKKNLPLGITKDMLCAGKAGKDTCRGDSGGPLVRQLKLNNISCEHEVVGLVSFGRGCGNMGVYTRVSLYIDWITDYIAPTMT